MSIVDLLSPLEWFFVILLGVIPLGGAIFHVWVMFMGHGKTDETATDKSVPPEENK